MQTATVPVEYVLKTATWVSRLAYTIAVIGVIGSYSTQVGLLLDHEVGWFSWVLPSTVDLLAVCAALALTLQGLDSGSRKIAGWILTVTVVVSIAANITGATNTVARLGHAWPVVAYLLGEWLANRVRAFAARLAASQAVPAATVSAPPSQSTVTQPTQPAPATPVFIPPVATQGLVSVSGHRPSGRSGPQVNGASRPSPLTGKPLLDGPPQV